MPIEARRRKRWYLYEDLSAEFPKLIERALAGEPQRVACHRGQAVVIISEEEWRARRRSAPTLGALLAQHARAGTFSEPATDRPWKERPLGISADDLPVDLPPDA